MAVDAAFVAARYAANLGAGHGFRWNAASPPCEGFTSTVQVVLLAIAGKLGVGPLGAAAALGAAAVAGLAAALLALARPRNAWFGGAAVPARLYVHVAKDSPHRAALLTALAALDPKRAEAPR